MSESLAVFHDVNGTKVAPNHPIIQYHIVRICAGKSNESAHGQFDIQSLECVSMLNADRPLVSRLKPEEFEGQFKPNC
jgi:hypothetical protein